MDVLITGITGMVGSHLADWIVENEPSVRVHGMARPRSPMDHVRHLRGKIALHFGDLRDLASLWAVLNTAPRFARVFHLAAQSFVPYSWNAPGDTLRTNVVGTSNLLTALLGSSPRARVLLCSSSEVYGQPREEDVPITEACPLRSASPYAASKAGAEAVALAHWRTYDQPVVVTRAFTHTGPRRGPLFAASSFARQIAREEAVTQDGPLLHGNLDSVRTWCDVRDVARAYWLALERCEAGETYNVGGDRTETVGAVLYMLKGLARVHVEHEAAPGLMRPADVTLQVPCVEKFRAATGWAPEIPLERTLADLLDYWRERT